MKAVPRVVSPGTAVRQTASATRGAVKAGGAQRSADKLAYGAGRRGTRVRVKCQGEAPWHLTLTPNIPDPKHSGIGFFVQAAVVGQVIPVYFVVLNLVKATFHCTKQAAVVFDGECPAVE